MDLLRTGGVRGAGVNAVARQSGVSKVLIYRYFGDMENLVRAAAERLDLTQTGPIDDKYLGKVDAGNFRRMTARAFRDMHERLLRDEASLRLTAEEVQGRTPLTDMLAEIRERQGKAATGRAAALVEQIRGRPAPELDVQAVFAIASAAIYFLTLRIQTGGMYNGIDLETTEGKDRIFDTLAEMIECVLLGDDRPK